MFPLPNLEAFLQFLLLQPLSQRLDATPPTTAPQATGRRESNTWTKGKRGDWLVRGKPGQTGTVTVARKNGQTSKERLGKVIWQDEVTALYEVVK